jgi:hypothetical protein
VPAPAQTILPRDPWIPVTSNAISAASIRSPADENAAFSAPGPLPALTAVTASGPETRPFAARAFAASRARARHGYVEIHGAEQDGFQRVFFRNRIID